MEAKYILHITDLHVGDPNNDMEFLREGKYREFINGLVKTICESNVPSIDAIVVTGDFVEKGIWKNSDHAKNIITYLLEKLELKSENTAMCLGNHDIINTVNEGEIVESRESVQNFMNQFTNHNSIPTVESVKKRAVLCKPSEGVWCLMIDSLLGHNYNDNNAHPGPGNLQTPSESDGIMELVRHVPKDEILIIGSHYSVDASIGNTAAFDDEEPDWFKKHIWREGFPLRIRIPKIREVLNKTAWLSGDIHRGGFSNPNNILCVTTGRIGTPLYKKDSSIPRQATVVKFSKDEISLLNLKYNTTGNHTEFGEWESEWKHPLPPKVVNSEDSLEENESQLEKNGVEIIDESDSADDDLNFDMQQISVLCEKEEEDILTILKEKKLYSWGRFETSGNQVLLSWVSVGPLLNVPGRLGAIVDNMSVWLTDRLSQHEINFGDVLLIGVDCWGAVLASQLSIVTGSQNFCIAARGRGKYHTNEEGINEEVKRNISKYRAVVLLNDLVATGHTQRWVYDKITESVDSDSLVDTIWLSLSILTDPDQSPAADCSFISHHGTACRIKRPFLPKDRVPDDDLVPTQISLH